MLDFVKNNKLLVFISLTLCVILFLTQSYYKKTESYKLEISKQLEISRQENIKILNEKYSLIVQMDKLKEENIKKNKQLHIIIKKNADGSSTKEITNNENYEQNNKEQDKTITKEDKQKEDIKIDTKENIKENEVIKEEKKTEIVEKSNGLGSFLLGAGSVVGCVLLHICVF
jgi:preprotein translocase subunit SecF